jgi:hypothetical protein
LPPPCSSCSGSIGKLSAAIASIPGPVTGLPVLLALLATLIPPDCLQPCPA